MCTMTLLVFIVFSALCSSVSVQEITIPADNQTGNFVLPEQISNRITNEAEYADSIDNIKYVCSLTLEQYNETRDETPSKESAQLRLATVCCPGYKKNRRGICQPHCKGGCGDGFCEFPDICTCPPTCAFNTVDRKCVCFEAVCPGGCPNGTCVADNTCDCNRGFIQSNNWTRQYTNSSLECIPYCFPFCTSKLFTTPENCLCNYTTDGDDQDFGNESLEVGFDNHRKSHAYLGHLFQSHGHPSFASGLAGFGLGALVGAMIGSRGKSKYKHSKGGNLYSIPGNYGAPGNTNSLGYGNIGHSINQGYPNYGANYPAQGTNYGGSYPGQYPNTGAHYPAQGTNYGGSYPGQHSNTGANYPAQGTNYGGSYPGQHSNTGANYPAQGTNYGGSYPAQHSNTGANYPAQGTNYGGSYPGQGINRQDVPSNSNPGNYGNIGQVSNHGAGQNKGVTYGAGQTYTGSAGSATGTSYGWNTPGQNSEDTAGKTRVPEQGSQSTKPNNGQRTNYGWVVPSSTNTGGSTGSDGKGGQSSTSWWSRGKGNSGSGSTDKGGSSGSGSRGRKRGKKH